MRRTVKAYIGLGSNLGDRENILRNAAESLRQKPGIASVRLSSLTVWPALGAPGQSDYLNAVAEVDTDLSPHQLLHVLQQTENQFGRQRNHRWDSRTLDLDLVLYDNLVLEDPSLTVPHPQMHLRSFVLQGLVELNPDLVCPRLKRPLRVLAQRLNNGNFSLDRAGVQLVSIGGLIGVGKSTLAERLAAALNAVLIKEEYDKNPFLEKVYHGQSDLALDSELFFLGSSASQLRKDGPLKQGVAVSDYVFFKALIYARQWLDSDALCQYRQVYESVARQVHTPVLILFLEDTISHCLERIRRRNRPYEQGLDAAFLQAQQDGYEQILAGWTACPVIRLNAADCVHPEQIPPLAKEVSYYLAGETVWK